MLKILLTLAAGETAARALHVLAVILLARLAGKESLGQFGFTFAVSSYLLILVQQGFDLIAVRDVSRDSSVLRRYASGIIGLRLVLAAVLITSVLLYTLFLGTKTVETALVTIFIGTYLTGAISLKWVFQALERPRPIAISGILAQVCFLGGVLMVRSPSDVVWAAVALVIGEAASAAVLLIAVRKHIGMVAPSIDAALWREMLHDSWPISVCVVLANLLYNFDFLALRLYGYRAELGLYVACYRCVSVFALVLGLVQTSVFPTISRSFPDQAATIAITRRLALYCSLAMMATALVITGLAPLVLTTLYGAAYQDGATMLRILAWALPILGVRTILRVVLFAYHRQRQDVWNIFWGVVTNITLDLVLIPQLGPVACAISYVCAEVVVMALTYVSWFRTTHTPLPAREHAFSTSA